MPPRTMKRKMREMFSEPKNWPSLVTLILLLYTYLGNLPVFKALAEIPEVQRRVLSTQWKVDSLIRHWPISDTAIARINGVGIRIAAVDHKGWTLIERSRQ